MNCLGKKTWLALALLVLLGGTAVPASAALNMTQIDMNDTNIGGWTTAPNPGIFHLFVIQGNNPQGAIVNSGTDQPINIPLADGTYEFTLLGNDNAGSESTLSSPGLTLSFTNGSATTTLRVSTVSPSGTTTLGGSTIRVSNFTFTPWQQSGINRVTNHFVGAFGSEGAYNDAVAHFTIEISSLPAGVVSWWRAEGNFNDSVDGNTGFPVNTVNFVSGRTGQAFSFNNSAMRVPSSANLNFGTGNFSGFMWVKTTVGGGFMVEKDIPGVNNPDWFVHLTGGQVRFVVGQGAGGGDPYVVSNVRVDDGRFHHLAWVRNGTSLSVYIDGVLSGQANAAFVGNVTNSDQFVIGAEINNESNNSLINTSVSVIDEVVMFNRALSAAEILSISGDLQPPVISLNGSNPMILECPAAYFEPGASVSDTFDPAPSLSISGSVDSHTPGTYTITYTSTDAKGNTSSATRTVKVVDTTPPVVSLNGSAPVVVECHLGAYSEAGATALDACDGDLALTITGSVDTQAEGTYTLTYTATDHAGNSASATRVVQVADTRGPTIALLGDAEITVECHLAYVDAGATASDECDGDLSAAITRTGSVDVNAVGDYLLTYTVSDEAHHSAAITRTVHVVDTIKPVVTLLGPAAVNAECHLAYVDAGATVLEDCDPHPALNVASTVNSNQLGVYTVTYVATDASGNVSDPVSRTVTVVDTTPPVVTLNGPATVTLECPAPYAEAGALVTDTCDPQPVLTITGSIDSHTPGTYTLTYRAKDASGNLSLAVSRTVITRDTTPPVVSAALTPVSRDRDEDEDEDEDGNFYRIGATATDACDTHPAVSALMTQPLTSTTPMAVSYKKEKKNRIKIQVEKKKLVVKLEGPSESALRALWTQVLAAGGFGVSDGQQVQLVLKKDKGEYEAQYRFDRDLKLTSAKGPGLKLMVWATDASGNRSANAEAIPAKSGRDDDRLSKRVAEVQPTGFALNQNYPNPFNPATTISYDLVEAAVVRLTIYNVMGQQVQELVAGAQQPGRYNVEWDGRDGGGQQVASGLYLYRLQAGEQVAVQKMLFAK